MRHRRDTDSLCRGWRGYILDERIKENVLRSTLYEQAVNKLGPISFEECFFFVPALAIGGAEDIKSNFWVFLNRLTEFYGVYYDYI